MMRWFVFALIAVTVAAVRPALADDATANLTKEQVETIVRDYLAEHPEVVVDALRAYQKQQQAQQAQDAQQALADHTTQIYDDPRTPTTGPADASVVIVEFFDYRCPYCRHTSPDIVAMLKANPDVRFVYKDFPILGQASVLAARAALAARKQNLYKPFHDALMSADIDFSEASIMKVAASVGIDTDKLKADMKDTAIAAYIQDTLDLAHTLSINGTPTYIVDGQIYPGALDRSDFDKIIAAHQG